MSGVLPNLLLVLVLVLVNAAFAGTELALVSLREGQLLRLEGRSRTGAVLARLAREPSRFLATIQIGITLAGFLASASAAVTLARPLEGYLGVFGDAAEVVAIVIVTLGLSYVTLVFGELAPKRIAMQRAEPWAMVMARPLAVLSTVTRPMVWALSLSTDVAVRLLGADPERQREDVTEEEFRDMVATSTTFTTEQRRIIDGAFEIAERSLSQIVVPRSATFVLDAAWTAGEALTALVDSGHSRAPVAPERNLDQIVGAVHLRTLVVEDGLAPVATVAAPIPSFPESAMALAALRSLQAQRAQMAAVVDEHGGVSGIITIEDLLEELVGEIYDETDRDIRSVVRLDDGSIVLPGHFPVHDLVDIGVAAPEGDYTTIAGLVLDRLGRIPTAPGDSVDIPGWTITVTGVKRLGITEVRLNASPPDNPSDGQD